MLDAPLSVRAALALFGGLSLGGLALLPHDPAAPPRPSPIDPVIRDALAWSPYPQPWRPAWGGDLAAEPVPIPWALAAPNPQPIPPFAARLAAALAARAELVADSGGPEAAASYVRRMVDELCPPPRTFVLRPPKGPWPPSEPEPILGVTVSPGDLVLFAATLRTAARATAQERLARAFEAGAMTAAGEGLAAPALAALPSA